MRAFDSAGVFVRAVSGGIPLCGRSGAERGSTLVVGITGGSGDLADLGRGTQAEAVIRNSHFLMHVATG